MIFRYLGLGILFLVMTVLGWVLIPFLYPFRKFIRKHKENFFWYFLNDTTKGRDAGDYGRFKHNILGFWLQCAIRNKLAPNKKLKNYVTHYTIRLLGGFFYSRQIEIPN